MPQTRRWGLGIILLAVIIGFVGFPLAAHASSVSLYSNTGSSGSTSIAGAELAQSFSTGTSPISLGQVSFQYQDTNDGSSPTVSSYSLELFAGNGGVPSTLIATLASDVTVTTAGNSTDSYTPSSPISLAPNSQYFVVLSGSTGNYLFWSDNAATPTSDVPSVTFSSLTSADGGATWAPLANNFLMSVNGTTLTVPTLSGFSAISGTQGQSQSISAPTSSAPGSFSYGSSSTDVATIAGNQITFANAGSTTITATFAPTDPTTYYSATISTTVTVVGAPPPPSPPPSPTTTTSSPTTTTVPSPVTTTTQPSRSRQPPTTSTTQSLTTGSTTTITTTTTSPTSTTTTTTTTTTPPVPPTTTPTTPLPPPTSPPSPQSSPITYPTSAPPNDGLFTSTESSQFVAQIDATAGDNVSGTHVAVSAITADPGTAITVEVHSTPQIILNRVTTANGTFAGATALPGSLEPGVHVLIIRATYDGLPETLVGAFVKTPAGKFSKIVQPTALSNYAGIDDPRLLRALRFGLPVYDVGSHSRTTVGLLVAGGSLLALVGAGGALSQNGALVSESSKSRSKVSSAVTKKLKAVGTKHDSWGDSSSTWRHPLTERVDRYFREFPPKVGRYSALLPRVLTDGSWLRAIFGAWSMLLLVVGFALGVLSVFFHSAAPFVPSVLLIYLLIALGVLDAIASVVAWVVIAIVSLVGGSIQSWADVRTLLGLGVLVVTVAFIAHAIRPLRRYIIGDVSERWERLFDYTVMPIFVAFATASMAKALNGLSGLTILSDTNLSAIRWIVVAMILLRLLGEDAALHFYPERSKAVQPAKLTSPRMQFNVGALVFKFALYLVVMDPYFGLSLRTITAAVLLAIPGVLKLREDSLPNSPFLHRWLPRGLTSFLFMMVLGSFLSFELLGLNPTTSTVDTTFLWLLVPGVVISVIDLFGREGGDWNNVWLKRGLGVFVWLAAAGLVTGNLILFK